MRREALVLCLAGLCICFLLEVRTTAQSGTRGGGVQTDRSSVGSGERRSSVEGGRPSAKPQFEERLWAYLEQAQYRNWGPLPGQTDEAYQGQSPHGERVKLYANRLAAGQSEPLRYGALLVKENYDSSGTVLQAITVMYRSKDYAADAGDWYWVKYDADGSVSTMNGMAVAGRVGMCADCHQSADGGDFVFANDR